MTTVRYRALSRYTMAQALLALTDYARVHPQPPFAFGPLDLQAITAIGLTVSGEDLTGPQTVLAAIPELVEVPA